MILSHFPCPVVTSSSSHASLLDNHNTNEPRERKRTAAHKGEYVVVPVLSKQINWERER